MVEKFKNAFVGYFDWVFTQASKCFVSGHNPNLDGHKDYPNWVLNKAFADVRDLKDQLKGINHKVERFEKVLCNIAGLYGECTCGCVDCPSCIAKTTLIEDKA